QAADHFQNLAARRKHTAAGALVVVESVHELNLFDGVIAFARGGINLAASRRLGPTLHAATLNGHRRRLRPAVGSPTIAFLRPSAHRNCLVRIFTLRHGNLPNCEEGDSRSPQAINHWPRRLTQRESVRSVE